MLFQKQSETFWGNLKKYYNNQFREFLLNFLAPKESIKASFAQSLSIFCGFRLFVLASTIARLFP